MQDDPSIQKFIAEAMVDRNRNVQNSNDTENALCGSLILVCTVFLTVLVVVLGNADNITQISFLGKMLLVTGLLTILGSMSCGVKHYFVNIKFYREAAEIHHKDIELMKKVNDKNYKTITKEMGENEDKLIPESNDGWLRWQVKLMILVGAEFMLFVISVLFDFGIR